MQWAEGTGKTLEEARRHALQQLGVPEDQVTFEVLERPGALGGLLGRAQFKVRAMTSADEATASAPVEEGTAPAPPSPTPPHTELAEIARELLQKMVTLMGSNGRVVVGPCTEEEVVLTIEGDDVGLLIGRHGATLDAIQLIVAIAANRQVDCGARIIVDAEGYRERHRQMLEAKARQHAAEAKATGREVVIRDLKSYERRYIHMVLKDDPDVETYSEGEGDNRVLVISPR